MRRISPQEQASVQAQSGGGLRSSTLTAIIIRNPVMLIGQIEGA